MSGAESEDAELYDVAKVIAAKETVLRDLGAAAAAPLDEDSIERMRAALRKAEDPDVRSALQRVQRTRTQPSLRLVADDPELGASGGAA